MQNKGGFLMIELMVLLTAVIVLTALCSHSVVSRKQISARAGRLLATTNDRSSDLSMRVISSTAAYHFTVAHQSHAVHMQEKV